MPAKSAFTKLDVFSKTVEDARVRTTSGGIVTITSLLIMFWLIWGEWAEYRRVVVHGELVVDKGRGERMEIHMNISFPHMPCELLTLDVMDVSGEVQAGIVSGVSKTRLAAESDGGYDIDTRQFDLESNSVVKTADPDYCGECYGAPAPANAIKPGCCNTCAEVRDAYAAVSWSFGRGENVEQCQREHYSEHLDEQRREGCRVEGAIRVNKVVGNFHFAPGKSFSDGQRHVHDLDVYLQSPEAHTFSHKIHSLRFGPQLTEETKQKLGLSNAWGTRVLAGTQYSLDPLDNTEQKTDERAYNFMYFLKVVSTAFLPLDWESRAGAGGASGLFSGFDSPGMSDEMVELGMYGRGKSGSIETHQYSVTSHKRSLFGGSDAAEGHAERVHAHGGIPGIFFSYDISPMKVINREKRSKTFSSFLVAIAAVVGGTLTVAAAIDRALYAGAERIKKLHTT